MARNPLRHISLHNHLLLVGDPLYDMGVWVGFLPSVFRCPLFRIASVRCNNHRDDFHPRVRSQRERERIGGIVDLTPFMAAG